MIKPTLCALSGLGLIALGLVIAHEGSIWVRLGKDMLRDA